MTLADLEVLVLRVRSQTARAFAQEALACYNAGAYRACVITTWVALVHDLIDKLRDLALSGDTDAKTAVTEFDRIQRERDTTAALKFERELLDAARDRYELLSRQEQTDLARLFEDRNRYSHPNLNNDSEALVASPELARVHLRNAVEHVMQRPPVQGKAALEEIRSSVESKYFPRTVDDATAVLSSTPLVRAKRLVVRDFYLGCITSLFLEQHGSEEFERRYAAGEACRRMHPDLVNELVRTRLTQLFDKCGDDGLPYLVVLGTREALYAEQFSPGLRVRLQRYVEDVPDTQLSLLNFASDLPATFSAASERINSLTPVQMRDLIQKSARAPSKKVIQRAIEMYEDSKSWDSANMLAAAIWERAMEKLTPREALQLVRAGTNSEVKFSFNYPPLVKHLLDAALITLVDVQSLARELDLDVLDSLIESRGG